MNFGLMTALVLPFLDKQWIYYCIGYASVIFLMWIVYFICWANKIVLNISHLRLVCELSLWIVILLGIFSSYLDENLFTFSFGYCIATFALLITYLSSTIAVNREI
jgi:hypothetical protein